MTCIDRPAEGRQDRIVRGLCLKCAMELLTNFEWAVPAGEFRNPLKPATWYNPKWYGWREADELTWREESPGYSETVEAVINYPRCDECPTFVGRELSNYPDSSPSGYKRLGRGCWEDASAAANSEFPVNFPHIFPIGDGKGPDDAVAMSVITQANHLLGEARNAVTRSWPTCEKCPIPELPKKKEASGPRAAVLKALSIHATMTRNDILGIGAKGLTNNSIGPLMADLVNEALVLVAHKGPAKFYSLA